MKKYRDLELDQIARECGIDFAYHTYKPNMCSCCYGPEDFPGTQGWINGLKHKKECLKSGEYSYVLFRNANNGSGTVDLDCEVDKYTYINWKLSEDQLQKFCSLLQDRLGSDYRVVVPPNEQTAICIRPREF